MKLAGTILLILCLTGAWAQSVPTDPVKVYPNPATDNLNIVIEDSRPGAESISIHSIIGNKMNVDIENLRAGTYRASIEDLPQGYYLVVVKDPKRDINATIKFLKK